MRYRLYQIMLGSVNEIGLVTNKSKAPAPFFPRLPVHENVVLQPSVDATCILQNLLVM